MSYSAAGTVLYQKNGVNFKTTVAKIAVSGTYPASGGLAINLAASALLNPNVKAVTGPNDSFPIPPRVTTQQLGGWQAVLTPTGTGCNATLQFFNGTTELTNITIPTVISNGVLVVELDHNLGS